MWLDLLGGTGSDTSTYPRCRNWLFEADSLWCDTLLCLDAGQGRGFVLPQVGMLDTVDSPRKALLYLRSGWGSEDGEIQGRGEEKGSGEELELIRKMKNNSFKKKKEIPL